MKKIRISAFLLVIAGALIAYFVYVSQFTGHGLASKFPFKLGLDLNGGSHLVYQADISKIAASDVDGAMETLRHVIESRINAFGVAEPIIQTEKATIQGQTVHKLVVELPGVTDVNKAIELIGKTPILEFKTEKVGAKDAIAKINAASDKVDITSTSTALTTDFKAELAKAVAGDTTVSATATQAVATASTSADAIASAIALQFEDTGLTGRYLSSAAVEFDQNTNRPHVTLTFDATGKKLFADITKQNVGKTIAIFLDGKIISAPVVQTEIPDGKAIITGNFSIADAKSLAQSLKYGALPVPVQLIGTQTIGASLGVDALHASAKAGIIGFIIISIFLLLWYRLPGLIAVISLLMYVAFNLAIFKLIPVVLTSAGLAGFILSIGMAVDGNILIFERMREELKKGLSLEDGIREGFARAWLSIRDSNTSSIITAVILYAFATSSLIKGFAFVFLIGVLVSMFTAITVSRTLLLSLGVKNYHGVMKFLFGNGIRFWAGVEQGTDKASAK